MSSLTSPSNRRFGRLAGAAVAAATAAGGLLAAAPVAHAEAAPAAMSAHTAYSFTTLDNQSDPTFNQLLGINSHNKISGYFGSGQPGHPNKGYTLVPPYGQSSYASENFPGSAQTQVTGLNNKGDTVGFWVNGAGTNRDFVEWNGVFTSYTDPHTPKMAGSVNQLLGINDSGMAVGFEGDSAGDAHGFVYDIPHNQASFTTIAGAVSVTDTAINDIGQVTGFYTPASGPVKSFLTTHAGLDAIAFPGASSAQALGLNNLGEVVGVYTTGTGSSAQSFGFT
jgi:hypothetical protein